MRPEIELSTATGIDLKLPLAGPGSRAYAYIIDWHIRVLAVLVWVLGWLYFFWTGDLQRSLEDRSAALWLVTAPGLFYVLYHPIIELIMGGDSPGKRYVGLRCVDTAGNRPSNGAILLRNIMRIVDSLPALNTLGLTCMLVNREHMRLGDMVAGTRVIVAQDDSAQALARLDRLQRARVPPQEAELIVDLLARWKTLNRTRRQAMARTLLDRHDQREPANSDAGLRSQLNELLDA